MLGLVIVAVVASVFLISVGAPVQARAQAAPTRDPLRRPPSPPAAPPALPPDAADLPPEDADEPAPAAAAAARPAKGTCPVCGRSVRLTASKGRVKTHVTGGQRCSGMGRSPREDGDGTQAA